MFYFGFEMFRTQRNSLKAGALLGWRGRGVLCYQCFKTLIRVHLMYGCYLSVFGIDSLASLVTLMASLVKI